eukprot:scaffold118622_cov19-Prasinocladus_malaysianus.AAC.1
MSPKQCTSAFLPTKTTPQHNHSNGLLLGSSAVSFNINQHERYIVSFNSLCINMTHQSACQIIAILHPMCRG